LQKGFSSLTNKEETHLDELSKAVEKWEIKEYPMPVQPSFPEILAFVMYNKKLTQSELSKNLEVSPSLLSEILNGKKQPNIDIVKNLHLQFHIDGNIWLELGLRVADVGCGAGTAAILMAEAFPASTVTGFDVSPESLAVARGRSGARDNLTFGNYPVEGIPLEPPNDLVTAFDVIHDLVDPLAGLRRIRESLADDGKFLMMEPNLSTNLEDNINDRGALLYGISTMHCMTQSLAKGGAGLGAAWGRQMAEDHARRAGFSSFEPLE
jgi:SAM-dependent methyltransferase